MDHFFKKTKCGILNDHFDLLGGGTVHSFKFIEFLKRYYDCDVYLPGNPKSTEWMDNFLQLDTSELNFQRYTDGIGEKYKYLFLNISHWRAIKTDAFKQYMLVFFPQFFFPLFDYKFLANSEYTKKNIIKKWKQSANKIHVIYPPIMTSKFRAAQVKKNFIVHVSRLAFPRPEADKGHRQMITAFKEMVDKGLKEWEFHLVGQRQDSEYVDELRQKAKNYPIYIHEGISFNELRKLYAQAKIYWHMTGISLPQEAGAQEHLGMTTLEAMCSGCVPIVLATGGQPEIIDDGKDGFLIKNIKQLKTKTTELVNNEATWKKMSKAAIERSKNFDEEIAKKKFYSVICRTDKVSIVILCWNNSNYTKACVERLYEVTPPGFELILVDNNSTDNTKVIFNSLKEKYASKGHKIKCLFLKKNYGFAKGNNLGLKCATKPYVLFLNNDTLPQWGWLEKMVDVLETKPRAGIVGARLYFEKARNERGWIVQHAGIKFDQNNEPKHIGWYQQDKIVPNKGIEEVEATTGACLLVRKELAEFNEDFIRGYYEDVDLCLRLRKKGWKIYVNHDARLIHYEGQTQNLAKKENPIEFDAINVRNKKLFHEIWDKGREKLKEIPISRTICEEKAVKEVEIGGGEYPLYPNYVQVDLRKLPNIKYQTDARVLPFPSNSLSKICACYILQCLTKEEARKALEEWFRCLSPGGRLEIHVPDMDLLSRNLIASSESNVLMKEIYGEQKHEIDLYKWGYTFKTLDILLSKVNFVRITKIEKKTHHKYNLAVIAYKPNK